MIPPAIFFGCVATVVIPARVLESGGWRPEAFERSTRRAGCVAIWRSLRLRCALCSGALDGPGSASKCIISKGRHYSYPFARWSYHCWRSWGRHRRTRSSTMVIGCASANAATAFAGRMVRHPNIPTALATAPVPGRMLEANARINADTHAGILR